MLPCSLNTFIQKAVSFPRPIDTPHHLKVVGSFIANVLYFYYMYFSCYFQPESGNIYLILFLKMGLKANLVFDKSQESNKPANVAALLLSFKNLSFLLLMATIFQAIPVL